MRNLNNHRLICQHKKQPDLKSNIRDEMSFMRQKLKFYESVGHYFIGIANNATSANANANSNSTLSSLAPKHKIIVSTDSDRDDDSIPPSKRKIPTKRNKI